LLLSQLAKGKQPEDFLFTRADGLPVKDFRVVWANACKHAGCPGLLFYDLRRTAARNLRRAGVAEGVIMEIAGWKTDSIFRRYAIVDGEDKRSAMAALESAETARSEQIRHNLDTAEEKTENVRLQ
jgi:integrase